MPSRGAIRPSSAARATEGGLSGGRRKGQAMIETVIVVIFLSLTFLWLFQYANLFTTKLVLTHAAARAARARAVGLNELMVWKSSRVASIPVAGKCLSTFGGDYLTPEQEVARIPEFLAAENYADARGYLDYELWPVTYTEVKEAGLNGGTVEATVTQEHPRIFTTADFLAGYSGSDDPANDYEPFIVTGTYSMENHYPYYMHDQGM